MINIKFLEHTTRNLFFTGKGGVGKTTVAAAIAVAIAQRGIHVHLSTTDPAAHVAAAMNNERLPTLSVSRIDPALETAKYSAEVLGKAGNNLDQQGKALLEEDLRSPCTAEIAVFRAFSRRSSCRNQLVCRSRYGSNRAHRSIA